MPKYRVEAPDGKILIIEGPAGATQQDIMRQAQALYKPRQSAVKARADATKAASSADRKRGGVGSRALADSYTFGFADEMEGAGAALKTGALNLLGRGPGYSASEAYDATTSASRNALAQYRQDKPGEATGNMLFGAVVNPLNVVGGGFIAGGARGAPMVARAAGVGAATGAVAGAGGGTDAASRAKGAAVGGAVGAATGAALQAGGNALGARAATARARPPTPQRQLANEGVRLTPGQMMGGTAQRIEDAAQSIPVAGDAIRNARVRGVESFDRVAINRVLAPINQALPENIDVGRDAVRLARDQVGAAYDTALNPVQVVPDQQFGADLARARGVQIVGAAGDELQAAVQRIDDAMQGGPITGRALKELDEELGQAIRATPNTPTGRALQRELSNLQDSLDGLLGRIDPQALAGKSAADEAFANLVRIETAAGGVGARNGVFSPAQLNSAVRSSAGGGRRSAAFARGDALMQDLTDPAMQVLPSTVPDSGTALRSIVSGGALTGGGAMVGVDTPILLGGAAAAGGMHALYSRPVVEAINAVYRASTPGAASEALAQLAQLASRNPALIPVYQDLVGQLSGQSGGQPTLPAPQP